ncbi:MAG: tyrosine-type recombinase/integrase [Acidimicrobiales bacterium]
MAQIVYRVTGHNEGRRVSQTFRNTDEGRRAVAEFTETLKDAKTVYDVRTRIGGRVVTKSFKRRKDADAWITTTAANRLRGIAIDPRRAQVTLKEYAKDWLSHRSDLAVRTAELYEWLLDRHILPTLGATSLGGLQPSTVRTWHAKLARAHPTTAAKAYRLLSSIMRTAVADEVLGRNPCQIKGAGVEKAPERPVATIAEVQALADAMPAHLRVAVLLAAWCQLRRGELLGLRRQDIDLVHRTITIRATRGRLMTGDLVETSPKSAAGRREIAVPQNALDALKAHLDTFAGPKADDLVFSGKFGGVLSPTQLFDNFKTARAKIARSDLRLHDLRHSGLTWSAAAGATTAELMHRAGHASPVAALRYQHATEDRDRVLADALAALASVADVVPLRPRDKRAMDRGEATRGSVRKAT